MTALRGLRVSATRRNLHEQIRARPQTMYVPEYRVKACLVGCERACLPGIEREETREQARVNRSGEFVRHWTKACLSYWHCRSNEEYDNIK